MLSVAKRFTDYLRDARSPPPIDPRQADPAGEAVTEFDSPDNAPVDLGEMEQRFRESFNALPPNVRHDLAMEIAKTQARTRAADVVRSALQEQGAPSLRKIRDAVGIDPSQVSKISVGALDEGPHLWTLYRIALALGKRLVIRFE